MDEEEEEIMRDRAARFLKENGIENADASNWLVTLLVQFYNEQSG